MARGVRATGNSLRVTAFTLLSVACAERITPTSNSNGVWYSSSVVGLRIGGAKSFEDRVALGGVHVEAFMSKNGPRVSCRRARRRARPRGARCVRCALRNARDCRQPSGSASAACAGLASNGTMLMQSTGQGAMHSSQPVQSSAITVCITRGAPTMASTGQGGRHLVQPMQRSSSMNATVGAASMPLSWLSGAQRASGERARARRWFRCRRAGTG